MNIISTGYVMGMKFASLEYATKQFFSQLITALK